MKWFNREWVDPTKVYELPAQSGDVKLETFTLSENDLMMIRVRATMGRSPFDHFDLHIKPDHPYIRLMRDGQIWMSDTPMERGTNAEFLREAHGKVFVGGLGTGLILLPLLEDPEVEEIHVVELDLDVIKVFEKAAANLNLSKLTIYHGDVWHPEEFLGDVKFDTIYFDIWVSICSDNYPETVKLHRKYRKYTNYNNKDRFVDSWVRDYVRTEHRRYG